MARNPDLPPEVRLEIGIMAAPFIPISLFIFGWTARESVHWCVLMRADSQQPRFLTSFASCRIAPTIGAGLYLPGIFLAFQSILMYVSMRCVAFRHSYSVELG